MTTLNIAGPGSMSPLGFHPVAGSGAKRGSSSASIQSTTPLHLTRRGWLVLVALPLFLLTAAALIAGAFFTSQAQAASGEGETTTTVRVSVAAGETLWSLASEYAPERDPRAVVEEIVELNALSSSTVQAGQSLHVPVTHP